MLRYEHKAKGKGTNPRALKPEQLNRNYLIMFNSFDPFDALDRGFLDNLARAAAKEFVENLKTPNYKEEDDSFMADVPDFIEDKESDDPWNDAQQELKEHIFKDEAVDEQQLDKLLDATINDEEWDDDEVTDWTFRDNNTGEKIVWYCKAGELSGFMKDNPQLQSIGELPTGNGWKAGIDGEDLGATRWHIKSGYSGNIIPFFGSEKEAMMGACRLEGVYKADPGQKPAPEPRIAPKPVEPFTFKDSVELAKLNGDMPCCKEMAEDGRYLFYEGDPEDQNIFIMQFCEKHLAYFLKQRPECRLLTAWDAYLAFENFPVGWSAETDDMQSAAATDSFNQLMADDLAAEAERSEEHWLLRGNNGSLYLEFETREEAEKFLKDNPDYAVLNDLQLLEPTEGLDNG